MTMALIEPRGPNAGGVIEAFPPLDSPLYLSDFFRTLYQRYEERFVYGAPLLADRGVTTRVGPGIAGLPSRGVGGERLAAA